MPARISHSCAFTGFASGWSWTACGIAFTAGHQLFEVTAMSLAVPQCGGCDTAADVRTEARYRVWALGECASWE